MKNVLLKGYFKFILLALVPFFFSPQALARTCQEIFKPDLILSVSNNRELLSGIMGRRFSSRLSPSIQQSLLLMKAELIKDYNHSDSVTIMTIKEVQIYKIQVLLEMFRLNRSLTKYDLIRIQSELNLSTRAQSQIRRSKWMNTFLYQSQNLALSVVVFWMLDELVSQVWPPEQESRRVPLRDILTD